MANPLRRRISMTYSIHSFVHDSHTTISNEETCLQDYFLCWSVNNTNALHIPVSWVDAIYISPYNSSVYRSPFPCHITIA